MTATMDTDTLPPPVLQYFQPLAELIRGLRRRRGWTQPEMARRTRLPIALLAPAEAGYEHTATTSRAIRAALLPYIEADRPAASEPSTAPSQVETLPVPVLDDELREAIRLRRKALGWTRRELSTWSDIPESTLAHMENGQRGLPPKRLAALLAALDQGEGLQREEPATVGPMDDAARPPRPVALPMEPDDSHPWAEPPKSEPGPPLEPVGGDSSDGLPSDDAPVDPVLQALIDKMPPYILVPPAYQDHWLTVFGQLIDFVGSVYDRRTM